MMATGKPLPAISPTESVPRASDKYRPRFDTIMRVGILGSGMVGQALSRGFASRGHDVKIGSRNPQSDALRALLKETKGKVSTGKPSEAAAFGEIIVLATNGLGTEAAIDLAGRPNFDNKLVIDVTNPLDGKGGVFVGTTDSLGERVQRKLPKAKVVKAFNTVPSSQMVSPRLPGGTPEMLICGNDADAKKRLVGVLKDFGWPGAIDVGGIEAARWLEAMVPLWVRVGQVLNTWDHVWKVERP
jgi:predicted dinucleotide-binding enzyme